MSANYSELRLGIIFSVILLMTGTAAAAGEPVVNVEEADKVVWMNEKAQDQNISVNAYCSPENQSKSNSKVSELYLWDNGQKGINILSQENYGDNENRTKFYLDISEEDLATGEHTIVAECGGDQAIDSFELDKLHLQLSDSVENIFLGKKFQTNVEVTSEAGNLDLGDLTYPSVYLKSENTIYTQFNDNQGVKKQEMTLESNREIPLDFISSDVDQETGTINVTAMYKEDNNKGLSADFPVSDTLKVDIKRWNIKSIFYPSRRMAYRDLTDMNASIKMMFEGKAVKPDTPEDTDFSGRFYLDDEDGDKIEPEKGEDGSYEWFSGGYDGTSGDGFGQYELKLEKTPKLEKGTHDLNVWFDPPSGDDKKIGGFTVENKFTFEGRVSDSDSRAVNTDFTLDSGDFTEEFSTGLNGDFSRKVLPGEYGFNVEFPKGGVTLTKTVLREDFTGNINYDYFKTPGDMDLDLGGIKPINLMTVSFGYPFDQARAEMEYNPAKVENPMNVQVFECVEWNFWSKECISGWDKISDEDVTLPPTEWTAKFPVTPVETNEYGDSKNVMLSAYMVGTRSGLRVSQIELDDYRVSKGSDYGISGKVVSNNGDVENADVTFSLMSDSEFVWNSSGQTDINGDFQISMEAPEEGNYSMHVAAEKQPYDSYSERIDETVWVYKNSEISMELPTQVDITPGETTETDITVSNEGQTTYSDIGLSMEGPEDVNISLSDSSISELEPGNSETVAVTISLPEDFCDPSCSQYPTFEISMNAMTDGKEVEDSYELNSIVKRTQSSDSGDDGESSQTSETSTEEDNDGGLTGAFSGLEDTPTGEFLASQSSLNIALGLIMVFTMALAGAIKKKKDGSSSRGGRDMSRTSRSEGRQVNIRRPKVSPSEEPEVMSPDDDIDEIAEAMTEKDQEAVVDQDMDEVEISHEEPMVETPEEDVVGEESDEESEDGAEGDFKCDTCGENFDTKSGLKLHREALH